MAFSEDRENFVWKQDIWWYSSESTRFVCLFVKKKWKLFDALKIRDS